MYSHTLLTTSPRAIVPSPTTAASSGDGCSGCCKAFGFRPAFGFSTRVPCGGASSFVAALVAALVVAALVVGALVIGAPQG